MKSILALINSPAMVVIRCATCLCICMVLLLSVATGSPSFSQQSQKYDAVVDEHRFTSLETEVREISDAVKEMKKEQEESYPMDVIKTLAMSGLIGEAGIRLIRNRKREE